MLHVRHEYCPKLERVCVKSEYDKPNHITICHRFRVGSNRCRTPRVRLDFCIDEYEYPNRLGAHPPVMVDWHQAGGLCARQGKRLCYEREWVAACEGPSELPFPYGWERSADKCNIDNPWIDPVLRRVYSSDPEIQQRELNRLDQSVPSGAKPECVSGYGARDLTGNFDEWARADRPRPRTKAVHAALKGGAWGHVRNACRPVTTSHAPDFTYYFVSFRCCQDPNGAGESGTGRGTDPDSRQESR
ncbi:formylglycine-generating enzyme family protein [Myxococcota bacterium]